MSSRQARNVFLFTVVLCTANPTSGNSFASRKALQAGFTETNILGGESAPIGRFPYVCHLTYTAPAGTGMCTGMLVAPRWVMTAAHCLKDETGEFTINEISCGAHVPTNSRARNRFESVEMHVHESFDQSVSQLRYDIALVRLDRAALFDVPRLSTDDRAFDSEEAYIAGWGEFDNSGAASRDLQVAQVHIIDTDECSQVWNEEFSSLVFEEDRLCAGNTRGRICNGDSGGPLIVADSRRGSYLNGRPSRDTIIGISSFGDGECNGGMPSVFTNVRYFEEWIDGIINSRN